MSGDFRKYPELQQYDELQSPWPGQYGTYWRPATQCPDLLSPIAYCCAKRPVSLADADGDRSDFTREAFNGI